jgi:hypothetical protein
LFGASSVAQIVFLFRRFRGFLFGRLGLEAQRPADKHHPAIAAEKAFDFLTQKKSQPAHVAKNEEKQWQHQPPAARSKPT